MPKKKGVFYGWWMVLISATVRFFESGTFFYGFTTFFNPIKNTFGWGATETSVAFSLQRLEMGAMGPVSGFLVDKIGPKRMMLIGWTIAGIGFILMSRIDSLWTFYGSFVFLALGLSLGSFMPANTLVAHWFIKKRSRAMTLSAMGPGISGTVVTLITWLILLYGWRTSLVIIGIAVLAICLPLCFLVKDRPGQYGYLPDGELPSETAKPLAMSDGQPSLEDDEPGSEETIPGYTVKEAVKTKAFWLICLVSVFQQFGTSAVYVHFMPYLESEGIGRMLASTWLAAMTICSLIGRFGFGFIGDFYSKRYLISIALTFQTVGLYLFSLIDTSNVWLLVLFLLVYAPGYGAPIVLRPALQADYFGVRSFGTLMGLISLVSLAGGLASPIIAGWIYDVQGSYKFAWKLFALISAAAVPLMLLAKPPKNEPGRNFT